MYVSENFGTGKELNIRQDSKTLNSDFAVVVGKQMLLLLGIRFALTL